MSAKPPELLIQSDGYVRVFTINRPHRRNAMSMSLRAQLIEEVLKCRTDRNVRVIVFTGAGEHAFCAGNDLKERSELDRQGEALVNPIDSPTRLLYEVVLETYKPTIAAVNGAAVGGGFELALACDIRIAASEARFALPEAKIGMGALFGSVILPRRIPLGIALELMFTGDFMSVEDAKHWGLVNRVVPRDELMPTALQVAQTIASNAPITVRRMKHMALKGLELHPSVAIRQDVGPDPYGSEDRIEGINAFLERRHPQWKDR